MGDNLLQNILNEISKTGFPLEMRIAKLLNEREYIVNQSAYYLDVDEGKSREIDIIAHLNRKFIVKNTNKEVFVRNVLVIECKKSENKHWVFFSSDKGAFDDQNLEELLMWSYGEEKPFSLTSAHRIYEVHPYRKYNKIARSYFEANKKASETGETIFKALNGVVKATLYRKQSTSLDNISIFYPMIIFEGRMFEAVLNCNNEIELKEVNAVLYTYKYISKDYSGIFTIPILRENVFGGLLEELEVSLDIAVNEAEYMRNVWHNYKQDRDLT